MTETRDESTGQFTPSSEGLYGREAELVEAGYIVRPDGPEAAPEEYGSDEASLRELARKKWGDKTAEIPSRDLIFLETGERVPDNVAQTVEQASSDLTNVHRWEYEQWEQGNLAKVAEDVDKARAEKIKGNPVLKEHYGVDPDADAAAKTGEIPADAARADGDGKNLETVLAEKPPAGDAPLDPVLDKAIREHPQVRQAVAEELGEARKVTEAYSAGLENSRIHTLATLAEVVPHLAGLPPQQFEQGLAVLAQVDPPAFQQAMNILGRAHTIAQAQVQEQQRQAQVQYQQFENHVRSEDDRLVELFKGDKAKAEAANQAVLSYLDGHGVPKDQRLSMVMNNPVLRTAEARETIWKAAKYDELMKAPAKAIPKPVPKIQKPGISASKESRDGDTIQAARAKLAASGSPDDAYALYTAKRKARG
jgi:hypothetical protein